MCCVYSSFIFTLNVSLLLSLLCCCFHGRSVSQNCVGGTSERLLICWYSLFSPCVRPSAGVSAYDNNLV